MSLARLVVTGVWSRDVRRQRWRGTTMRTCSATTRSWLQATLALGLEPPHQLVDPPPGNPW
jgi:hypothetical protein